LADNGFDTKDIQIDADHGTGMALASEFAGHICGIKGALPEDERIYKKFRKRIHKR